MKNKKIKILTGLTTLVFAGLLTYQTVCMSNRFGIINLAFLTILTALVCLVIKSSNPKSQENKKKSVLESNIIYSIETIPVPAYVMDIHGRYLCGNKHLKKLTNFHGGTTFSTEIFDEIHSDTQNNDLKIIVEKQQTVNKELSYRFDNNSTRIFNVTKSPILNIEKKVCGVIVYLVDVTQKYELINQQKRFIATLNHDLKTPIIAQIRSLSMLLNEDFGKINPDQKEILELTASSCNEIYDMIRTVLSSYKFENKEIKLDHQKLDFQKLVQGCCKLMEQEAEEKNIKFVTNFKEDENIINADINYLKPTVLFLLKHSISYSFPNSFIEISTHQTENDITFEIITKSPYIPEETLHSLMDKYVGQISSYTKIGFGIKLNYCTQVINAHRGKIIFESKPTNENTLGFSLPLKNQILFSGLEKIF